MKTLSITTGGTQGAFFIQLWDNETRKFAMLTKSARKAKAILAKLVTQNQDAQILETKELEFIRTL